jgi:hypothetical protein
MPRFPIDEYLNAGGLPKEVARLLDALGQHYSEPKLGVLALTDAQLVRRPNGEWLGVVAVGPDGTPCFWEQAPDGMLTLGATSTSTSTS